MDNESLTALSHSAQHRWARDDVQLALPHLGKDRVLLVSHAPLP